MEDEDVKGKLAYESFPERSWEEIDKSLHLLRDVKYKFTRCAEECYSQGPENLSIWENVRNSCVQTCQNAHDSIFSVFTSNFSPNRDTCLHCALDCGTEYPISKYGEEDLRICEEKCYEKFYKDMVEMNQALENKYQSVYLQKYKHY
ncbi:hypothetical protein SteCoe_15975 [Stentor coeruleus]|uniref:Uncharacterized protein n=1 Tax=Stentor coeruleus TaxID=5963 RepID=A0A1R2C2C4_9CILI|nr:hypothetical protein SteCoe_15975 [Stentor coeruleus]